LWCRQLNEWVRRGNRSTRRKPAPVPLLSAHIPHDLTRARTRTAAIETRRLTAWSMVRPLYSPDLHCNCFHALSINQGMKEVLTVWYSFLIYSRNQQSSLSTDVECRNTMSSFSCRVLLYEYGVTRRRNEKAVMKWDERYN
jgi:hypothetical protein